MAIFTSIGVSIAGALFAGSAIAAQLISAGLAIAAQLAISYLNRPKKRKYAAVQGEKSFGAETSQSAVFGTSLVAGQQIDYFKHGSGNSVNTEVIALSTGWCKGLQPTIIFDGKAHTLLPNTVIGNEIENWKVDGYDDLINIRFYDGRPNQLADAKLIADTAALDDKWTTNHVGANHAYVIVDKIYDAGKFPNGIPNFQFVIDGLREYDLRKDDTVTGGAGNHRVNDPSTWEHTTNPAVHRLNYVLGVKALLSGRSVVGMGKTLGQIDVASHIVAANVCDTVRIVNGNSKPTYACSLVAYADDDHTEVLKEFEDAMAGYGMNRFGLSGVLAGAPQIPVLDIGPDDIRTDEGQSLKLRKSAFDQYNVIASNFTSPESLWNPEPLTPVSVNADITQDGRRRSTRNDFLQVTDADIAQYLLNIRYRQNRLGGSAKIPVSSRVGFKIDVGDWVTYKGVTWLVKGRSHDANLKCTLTLAETSSDIYSEAGIEAGPVVAPKIAPVNPSLLSTVSGYDVNAGFIGDTDGSQDPSLKFDWTPPEDPTIDQVVFEYWDVLNPTQVFTTSSVDPESGTFTTSNDVLPGVIYESRATIRTIPDRFKTYTPTVTTSTATPSRNLLPADLGQQIRDKFNQVFPVAVPNDAYTYPDGAKVGLRLKDIVEQIAADQAYQTVVQKQETRDLAVSYSNVHRTLSASITQEALVRVDENTALAALIDTLTANLSTTDGNVSANSTAVGNLQTQVTANGSLLTTQAASITSLNSSVSNLQTGQSGNATAITALTTQVATNADGVTAASSAAISAQATADGATAQGLFKVEAVAAPAGVTVRLAMAVRKTITGDPAYTEAGIFIDIMADDSTRIIQQADTFIFTDGTDETPPMVYESGALRLNVANIGTVTTGVIDLENGYIIS